jgi:peptidoglycan/LPS O-acetylase OafA/YrhL
MVLFGVFGYANERRKRGAAGARRFLLWYAVAIPFMACAVGGEVYHRLHWLLYVAGALAVGGVLAQLYEFRRARNKARGESAAAADPPG